MLSGRGGGRAVNAFREGRGEGGKCYSGRGGGGR